MQGEHRLEFGVACALKGGHLDSDCSTVIDVLYCDGVTYVFSVPRVDVGETHGTGCSFAAAVTAGLANGLSISDAVRAAQIYVAAALVSAPNVGSHTPLGAAPSVF